MIKCKWLRLQSSLPPSKVMKAVLNRTFSNDADQGFLALAKIDQSIFAKYTERTVIRENLVNPYGEVSESESVKYSIISFRLHYSDPFDENYVLEVLHPPRTLRPLLRELSDALDGIVVHEPKIQLLSVFTELKNNSFKAKIVRLKASGIEISPTSELKAEVLSSSDAYSDLISRFDESRLKLEKIRIENPFPTTSGPLELSVNGLCSFDERIEENVRSLLLGAYRRGFSTDI